MTRASAGVSVQWHQPGQRQRQRQRQRWASGAAAALACALAGCAGPPPINAEPAAPSAVASPPEADERVTALEQAALDGLQAEQRAAARQAQREGRHPAAQQAWSVVLALDANDAEALTGFNAARRNAAVAARDSMRRADQARARGDRDGAMRLYLEALAQDGTLGDAVDALRALESERARRNGPQGLARAPKASVGGSPAAAAELEHADLLLAEGDIEAAVLLLEPLARKPVANATLKRRVCDLLLRQAEPRPGQADDPDKALPLVQRCLRLLPQHPPALQRQRTLRAADPPRR